MNVQYIPNQTLPKNYQGLAVSRRQQLGAVTDTFDISIYLQVYGRRAGLSVIQSSALHVPPPLRGAGNAGIRCRIPLCVRRGRKWFDASVWSNLYTTYGVQHINK